MIVLEGPDGSGKTTLKDMLLERLDGVEEHERASTSKGGPVKHPFAWAEADVLSWDSQPFSLYDRHPFISEPIYGTVLRGGYDHQFNSEYGRDLGHEMCTRGLIVLCLPPLKEIRANVAHNDEDQMSGVVQNIDEIALQYQIVQRHFSSRRNVFWYDYTRPGDLEKLVTVAKAHQIMWNKNRGIHG